MLSQVDSLAVQVLIPTKYRLSMCTSYSESSFKNNLVHLVEIDLYPSLWSIASVLIHLVAFYTSKCLAAFPLLIKRCNKVYFCIIKTQVFVGQNVSC